MPETKELLSSQEFAKRAGVSPSTISKWLRSGKIEGSKQGGKWMISADQLNKTPNAASSNTNPKQAHATGAGAVKPAGSPSAGKPHKKAYTIEEFSSITYLTPFGVERYLKEKRLSGTRNESGQWQIDGANLENPAIQRLVRK